MREIEWKARVIDKLDQHMNGYQSGPFDYVNKIHLPKIIMKKLLKGKVLNLSDIKFLKDNKMWEEEDLI